MPAELTCPSCTEPVLANWKACPACGTKLAAPAEPQVARGGEGSVVKATVNRGGNGPAAQPPQPLVQAGDGSVVKADVDASTHYHTDRSLKVSGQFVANQTVVNESSVGTIVRMLLGGFTTTSKQEIEAQLPDTAPELFAILAQTLHHQVRQEKLAFKKKGKLLGYGGDHNANNPFAAMAANRKRNQEATERQELCQKILDKLHDIGRRSRDKQLLEDIERLDNCLIETQRAKAKNDGLEIWKVWGLVLTILTVLVLLLFLAALFGGQGSAIASTFVLLLLSGGGVAGIYYGFKGTVAAQEVRLKALESDLDTLLGRYTA
jgi:hypothetical protein